VECQVPGSFCCVLRLNGEQLSIGGATSNTSEAFLSEIEALKLSARLAASEEDPASADTWQPYRVLALQHGLLVSGFTYVRSAAGEPLGIIITHHQKVRLLARNLESVLGSASKLTALAVEHAALADRLSYQAQYDVLTGLPNRALFQDRLRQAINLARRNRQIVAVMFMDLDGFKRVNDTLGHRVGDKLLKDVASRFQKGMRSTDTLARHGGDEFMVVINGIRHTEDAARIAQFMLTVLDEHFKVHPHEIHLTASIGISLYPNDGEEEEMLLLHADAAMYKAKAAGQNSFECFTPELHAQLVDRIDMEGNLFNAISRGEMGLRFQPMHRMDQSVLGFEALLRWTHPKRGLIAPERFITIAEESGLIVPIGRWVLEESCSQCAKWRAAGYSNMRVSVNVSATQFEHPGWTRMVAEALAKTGLESAGLELELTEHLIMRHATQSIKCIHALKAMGVSIAIDDFGIGHSSLAHLQQLPIDTLKIDRSFISGIKSNSPEPSCAAIVEAIVKLGTGLGMQVMAEGVETEAQLNFLRRIGCHAVQGYYYARAMTVSDCDVYLEQNGTH
ncbi:MAG TPA: EAL domain-containing protein, partial [Gammaproteobacteria bacterium]|nr:EAL domain-containing protein [Gammaproteobacteria bacterium]